MKKGLKYLLGLGAIAVLPFAATGTINGADSAPGMLLCPNIALAGDTIECTIYSEDDNKTYTGVSEEYVLPEGITYNSFSSDHNYYVNLTTEKGFVLGDATELPSEIGKVKFTLSEDLVVGQDYTISLSKVNYTDTEYNDYDFTSTDYSDTITIVEDVLEFDSSLTVEDDLIYRLPLGYSVGDVLERMTTNGLLDFYIEGVEGGFSSQGNDGIVPSMAYEFRLVTGHKLKIQLHKSTVEYTLSVRGDVTSDGYVKMGDVMKVANQVLDENTITGEAYLKAADVTDDEQIKMGDVMKLANHVLEGGEL